MAEKKGAPEGEPKKSKKKLFIMVGTAVLVLALGGGAGFYFMKGSDPKKPEAVQAAEGEAGGGGYAGEEGAPAEMADGSSGERVAGIGPMVNIDSFVINIMDDQESRFLKAALTLELDSPGTVEQVNARMPQIRDSILLLVGNKTYNELRDMQGKLQLRAELTAKLNSILRGGQIKKIYFTDFVVQ